MSYRIAGIDVHKKMLAVVVCDVERNGESHFERKTVGTSPDQLRALADWMKVGPFRIAGHNKTIAGLSGGLALERRPALLAALAALGCGDMLIVAKRDRLGRDVLNVAMLARLVERKGSWRNSNVRLDSHQRWRRNHA